MILTTSKDTYEAGEMGLWLNVIVKAWRPEFKYPKPR